MCWFWRLGRLGLYILIAMGCMNFCRPLSVQALSMTVNEGSLSSLVTSIARSEGLNIIGTETLAGKVSIKLQNETARQALQRLARLKHFSLVEEEGVIIVNGSGLEDKEPRYAELIEPKHMKANSLGEAIKAIVEEKHIHVLSDTNQVLVYGTDAELRHVKTVLNQIDRVPQQVRFEAAIVAVEHSYLKETGIQWSWQSFTGHGQDETGTYGGIRFGKAPSGEPYNFFVKPELKAQENKGNTVLIARPSITTVNGEKAKILIGDRIPVLVETKEGTDSRTTVEYEEAGIRLTCVPTISADSGVDADIYAEVSSPTMVNELKAYRITTRQAETRVHLNKGDVLVIGGLMDNRWSKQSSKIPLLGDIPLLGKLFQHARKTKDTVELYIFVKAELLPQSNSSGL
ncbi:type II secretion system protein GspD [uncultured Veillonella sp.]|uniref:type II secretion system protein GspD n=1 Tax=uncultured Veillonella sp. TaxID=159268 RepID=UPI0025D14F31|nr:secretion protein [uncultured Veillonella sp.]MDY3974083.1 secretion protein [Veillonella caviae]